MEPLEACAHTSELAPGQLKDVPNVPTPLVPQHTGLWWQPCCRCCSPTGRAPHTSAAQERAPGHDRAGCGPTPVPKGRSWRGAGFKGTLLSQEYHDAEKWLHSVAASWQPLVSTGEKQNICQHVVPCIPYCFQYLGVYK